MKSLCVTVKISHGTTLKKAIQDAVQLKHELDLDSISFVFNGVDIEISIEPTNAEFIIKYFEEYEISTLMDRRRTKEKWISV